MLYAVRIIRDSLPKIDNVYTRNLIKQDQFLILKPKLTGFSKSKCL